MAVYGPIRVRLEWNLAFLIAFRTNCLMHLFLSHELFSTPSTVYFRVNLASYTLKHWTMFMDIKFAMTEKPQLSLSGIESKRNR